jgi:hypothetical protein
MLLSFHGSYRDEREDEWWLRIDYLMRTKLKTREQKQVDLYLYR